MSNFFTATIIHEWHSIKGDGWEKVGWDEWWEKVGSQKQVNSFIRTQTAMLANKLSSQDRPTAAWHDTHLY